MIGVPDMYRVSSFTKGNKQSTSVTLVSCIASVLKLTKPDSLSTDVISVAHKARPSRLVKQPKQSALVNYLKQLPGVRQVNSSDTTASSLTSFNALVAYISAAIIIILLAVAVFLISTTVAMGISVRKNEISIMRLIGATDFMIRSPFIVEGIVIGIIGAIIPLGILFVVYNVVIDYIVSKFSILNNLLTFLSVEEVFRTLVPVSMLLGIGIGFVGSYTTVRKHLNKV